MRRRHPLTSNEKLGLGLFGGLGLLGLMGILFGTLAPTGTSGQIEPQTGALCIGPFLGALGAMALIWLRQRVGKPSTALVSAIVMWFVGVTLLGWGIFNAFNPGDNTLIANFGYSVSLCFAPGLVFSLLALGAYWYSELRTDATVPPARMATEGQPATGPQAQLATNGYGDVERRAADYRRRIVALIRRRKKGPMKDALLPIVDKIDAWEARIRQMTGWLATFEGDTTIQRDLRETPIAIERLQNHVAAEADPEVQAQMNDTLAGYAAQQDQLNELQSAARQARLQLEEALSAMGRIYSQLQLLTVKELENGSARRISEDIQEQTDRLGDLLSSVAEVYAAEENGPDAPSVHTMKQGRLDAAGRA